MIAQFTASWWRDRIRRSQRTLDRATEATLGLPAKAGPPANRAPRRIALALIPILVLAVAWIDYASGDTLDPGIIYHLPILYCCALLGLPGLWVVPICFILFLVNEALYTPNVPEHVVPWHSPANRFAHLATFTLVAALTVFARRLYVSVAEQSRRLLARQRLSDAEMALAEQVQRSLFNVPPGGYRESDLAIYAHSIPLSRVGGDFCHLVHDGEDLRLFIGDVVGKGVPAALVTAMCITALIGDDRRAASPDRDLQRCSDVLFNSFLDVQPMTATACAASFDRQNSEFVFSLAGHEPPILLTSQVERCDETGLLMGVVPKPCYPLYRIPFRPGDRILLFTDGVTEAMDAAGEQFGRDRLEQAALRWADLRGDELLRQLLTEIHCHVGRAGLRDDLALVVVERLPDAGPG